MEQHRLAQKIVRIAESIVRSLGLAIWGVEIIPSGRAVVRIYVDTPSDARDAKGPHADESAREAGGKGPSIDQCANVSRHIGLALEAEESISHPYVLEVSSPGLARPFFTLAQLAPYVGDDFDLKLENAQPELPDRRHLRGRLQAVGASAFTLLAYDAPENTQLSIPWDNVRKATLVPDLPFANITKPGKKKSAFKADATSKQALAASPPRDAAEPGPEAD